MELIKQYVDLLIRRQQESLEYQRVYDQWNTLPTDETKALIADTKSKMDAIEQEIAASYHQLKEKGVIAGGDSPWGSEIMRYTNWLTENGASHPEHAAHEIVTH